MYAVGHAYNLLSPADLERIHAGAMRILREMGMEIQHTGLLGDLAEAGLEVDFNAQRVRFPTAYVEEYIARAPKFDWSALKPEVGGSAGIYHGRFHDPETGQLMPWTEERIAWYMALANSMTHVHGASMLGSRLDCPAPLEPLFERYYNWKYGGNEGSSIYLDETCPYLYDLYQVRAEQVSKPIQEVFHGTVYLVPALKLGQHEAYQVAYFREHGLRVRIGDMFAMGASSPVTLIGSVTLNLAEQLALRMVNHVWFGVREFGFGGSISVMDMRTMIYPYGRPEMGLVNMMLAQVSRHYGMTYSGHAGLADAKLPSVETGYQKALTAIPTFLCTGRLWMDAGLLSIDEVCSPVQLVLDNEFLSALAHMAHSFPTDDEAAGIETILAAGPGGHYLDKDHTVRYLRTEHWQPRLWSREMLSPWLEKGTRRLDADIARDIAMANKKPEYPSHLTEQAEQEILKVIDHAGQATGVPGRG